MSMASRMAVMSEGRIVQLGTPREIYESPANRFVADFIGAVNLFAGHVTGVDGALLLVYCAEAGALLAVDHQALPVGEELAIALRPEKIKLEAAPSLGRNRLSGRIAAIAYRGDASSCEIELATGKMLRVTVPNTQRHAAPFAIGQPIGLVFDPGACVVLKP